MCLKPKSKPVNNHCKDVCIYRPTSDAIQLEIEIDFSKQMQDERYARKNIKAV